MTPKWEYGKSPAPSNWAEAVRILKQQQRSAEKKDTLMDRLSKIETMLKEKKENATV